MRKALFFSSIILLLSAGIYAPVQGAVMPSDPCDQIISPPDVRYEIIDLAITQVGVHELTGNNDGVEVQMYQAATGNVKGDQWCASFVAWCYKQSGLNHTGNAYSPSWFTTATTIYKPSANIIGSPQPGDVFGVWVTSKKRVGHVGLIERWGNDFVSTIEGNYSDRVVRQKRVTRQVYVASDWVSNQSTI